MAGRNSIQMEESRHGNTSTESDKRSNTFSLKWKIFSGGSLLLILVTLGNVIYLLSASSSYSQQLSVLSEKLEESNTVNTGKCGGTVYVDCSTGQLHTIQTPNYPNAYPNNLQCVWDIEITASEINSVIKPNYFIRLNVTGDIENSTHCRADILQIRLRDEQGPVLASSCGNVSLKDFEINDDISILFKSDGANAHSGVQATVGCFIGDDGRNTYQLSDSDKTFTHWGERYCPLSTSPVFYGTAVGFFKRNTASLVCTEGTLTDSPTDSPNSSPQLIASEFDVGSPVQCTVCLLQRKTTYMQMGSSECTIRQSGWEVVYSGYLVSAIANGTQLSAPICLAVDSISKPNTGASIAAPGAVIGAPVLVSATTDGQPTPCALCAGGS